MCEGGQVTTDVWWLCVVSGECVQCVEHVCGVWSMCVVCGECVQSVVHVCGVW